MSLFFTTLITPLSIFGIDNVLIQKKDPDNLSFSTHFVLRIILGFLIILLSILISPLLLKFYEDQKLIVYIFLFLLLFNLLEASYSTQNIVMRRELKFGPIAILNLVSSIAMTIIAPTMAYLGAGIWSLVAEQVIGPIIRWIGFWLVFHPWHLSIKFSFERARLFLRLGSIYMTSNLLGLFLNRFDDFWVGTFLGTKALGYYSRAYALAQYPGRVIAKPIVSIFYPTYAAVQHDKVELSKAFFRSSSFLIRTGFLLALVLMVTAPEITIILFTATWLPIVPIFRLMLIYILLDPFYMNLSFLFAGVGQPAVLTHTRIIQTVFFLVAVISFADLWGVKGVAIAANLMMLIGTIILVIKIRSYVSYSLTRMLLWPTVALILASIAGVIVINYSEDLSIWVNLILKGSIVTIVYLLALYVSEREIFHEYSAYVIKPIWEKIKTARK